MNDYGNIMKSSFWGRFWLLGFFTVMAFNGHIYFIVGILRGKAEWKEFIINIVYSNIFDASMIIIGCWAMLKIGKRIRSLFLRHLIISLFAISCDLFKFFSFGLLYRLFREHQYTNISNTTRDWYDLLFVLGPLVGINIVYSNIFDASMIITGCWAMLKIGKKIRSLFLRHLIISLFAISCDLFKFFSFGLLYKLFREHQRSEERRVGKEC